MSAGYESSFTGRGARILRALLSFPLWLVLWNSLGAEDLDLTYYGSIDYSTGEYLFTRKTNSLYILNGVALTTGRLRIFGDIPVILQSTPWISFAGGNLIPTGGTQHEYVDSKKRGRKISLVEPISSSSFGIGDPEIGADLTLLEETVKRPWLDISAQVKLPVADVDRGFGTGTWDFGGGISIGKWLGDNRLSADLTYWLLGDLEELPLENSLVYQVTWSRTLSNDKYDIQLSTSGSTEQIRNVDPPLYVSAGLDYEVSPRTDILTDVSVGLTESASDFTISFGWQIDY